MKHLIRIKRVQKQTLKFLPVFFFFEDVLTYLSAVSHIVYGSQNGVRKLSSPYIFVTIVQLPVFTSSCLTDKSFKMSHPFLSAGCRREEHPFPLVLHFHWKFRTEFFLLLSFVISVFAGPFGDFLLIYLFIHFQFSMSYSITLHNTSIH